MEEHVCVHTQEETDDWVSCMLHLLGRFNTRNYTVVATAEVQHLFQNVMNLQLLIVGPQGEMQMRGAVVVDEDREDVVAERKKMFKKIKSACAKLFFCVMDVGKQEQNKM